MTTGPATTSGTTSGTATGAPSGTSTTATSGQTGGSGTFQWPADGPVIAGFGPLADGLDNAGINIAAEPGAPIRAAQAGSVVYAGNELRGYGNLILVRHEGGWVTAYAHADQISVERGQTVQAGQVLGTVGDTGSVTSPQLHFEIRQGSDAIDPMTRLPPR